MLNQDGRKAICRAIATAPGPADCDPAAALPRAAGRLAYTALIGRKNPLSSMCC